MTTMQILAISDVYLPRVCGVSTSLRTLMSELQAKGHAVTLIAPSYPEAADSPGDDVIRVSSYALPFGSADRAMKMHRVLELTERLSSWNYDVVHIHTPFIAHFMGVVLGRRLQVPVVENWNTVYAEDFHRLAPYLRHSWTHAMARWLSHFQCRGVNGLIVNSTGMYQQLQDYGVHRPVKVVPAGIETHLFKGGDGARFRAAHDLGADCPMLLSVGRLEPDSRVEFLLTAVAEVRQEIPDVVFAIVGAGPAEPQLRAHVEQLRLADNVVFVGEIEDQKDLLDCYNAADSFVFAASGESQGNVLLEAMAAGLPVVAAAGAAGTQDILTAESPAVVTDERIGDFAAQVVRVLREPQRRAELALAGREYAQRWSASVTVEQVLDCYQEVASFRRQPERALAR